MDSASSVITLLSQSPGSSIVQNGDFSPSRAEVREQLARLLDSSLFRSSRRYPGLLQFIVERTLDGQIEQLKERTLGVEVFGRRADYDTNQDPIVAFRLRRFANGLLSTITNPVVRPSCVLNCRSVHIYQNFI